MLAIDSTLASASLGSISLNPVALMSTALATLTGALAPIGGAAVAIVVLTIAVRLALHPLARATVRGERARAALAPQVAELRRHHGSDLVELTRRTQALHRAEGVSPYAGMLSGLIQLPVFSVLYLALVHGGAHGGALAGASVFGVALGAHLFGAVSGGGVGVLAFAALLGALGVLAWANARRVQLLRRVAGAPPTAGAIAGLSRIAPYIVVVSAAVLPLAAGIYLVTTTAWSLAENVMLRRGLP